MTINLLNGQMLNANLERDGTALAFINTANSTPTLYLDVANTRVGINSNTPTSALTVAGNIDVASANLSGNLSVVGTSVLPTITNSLNGNVTLIATGTGVVNISNLAVSNTTINSTSTGNLVNFGGTYGIILPVGNTLQRPSSPALGTLRFDTTTHSMEVWDGSAWVTSGSGGDSGTITDQQITPDGTSTSYTLNKATTTNSVLVYINGVNQMPGVSYSVSGNTITFTQPPQISDIIDVRFIAYTATVSTIINSSGSAYAKAEENSSLTFATNNTVVGSFNAAGVLQLDGPGLQLPSYTVSGATAISSALPGQVIYVSNGNSGQPCLAVFDGTSWKRVALGTTISAT